MADPKQKKNEMPALDSSNEREQGLSRQFDDLRIEDLLPVMSEGPAAPGSLVADVAEAVQELVAEAKAPAPAAEPEPILNFELVDDGAAALQAFEEPEAVAPMLATEPTVPMAAFEPQETLSIDGHHPETAQAEARIELALRLFELVVCEKSFNELCNELLAAFVKGSSAVAGSLLELDQDKGEFFFRSSLGGGDPAKLRTFRVPANVGIVGHVAESGAPMLLNDMEHDQLQLRAVSMSVGFEVVSCLAVPIYIANRIYGVIELFNKNGDAGFDQADLRLIEEGALMAGKVLEVRFLMAELLRRAR